MAKDKGGDPGPSTSFFEGLLERMNSGDTLARDRLIQEAYPRALRLTRIILRLNQPGLLNNHSEDVCNISYEKFAKKLCEGSAEPFQDFRQSMIYLARIIRTTAIDESRKFRSREADLNHAKDIAQADLVRQIDDSIDYYERISRLPDMEREVMDLKFSLGYTQMDIARSMKIDRKTVVRIMDRAALRLRREADETRSGIILRAGGTTRATSLVQINSRDFSHRIPEVIHARN